MALREIRRVAEAASEAAYQARTTVCSRPNARIAMTSPRIVSRLRSLARKTLRKTNLRKNTQPSVPERCRVGELTLVEIDHVMCGTSRARIVRDHHDRLAQLAVQPVEQAQDVGGRLAVQISGGLVGDHQ